MRIALAQADPIVGDINLNKEKVLEFIELAKGGGADVVVFPELMLTGYPPCDLLFNRSFLKSNIQSLNDIIEASKEFRDLLIVVGFVDINDKENETDKEIIKYNCAALIRNGKLISKVRKTLLPTYDVFDEARYFEPNDDPSPVVVEIKGKKVSFGIQICEDLWDLNYDKKVTNILKGKGANLIINLSSSPFHIGKYKIRDGLLADHAREDSIPMYYCNLIGGQDELIFDGNSTVMNIEGELIARGAGFKEDLIFIDHDFDKQDLEQVRPLDDFQIRAKPDMDEDEEIHSALVLGVGDYFCKQKFNKAIIGLSGGIDSALTAAIAVEALGKQNVMGVLMPSGVSSDHSVSDAEELSKNLGIEYLKINIQEKVDKHIKDIEDVAGKLNKRVSIENIQARIRGDILMTLSNDRGYLVLSTGNKTELALGYCTLYGDMAGGLSVINDVDKIRVYSLCRYINEINGKEIIPQNTIDKPPSAELSPDQVDPFDYEKVVPISNLYIEDNLSKDEIIKLGHDPSIVEDTVKKINISEYKRRQATIGLRITHRAFGVGRRMPIVNLFRG